MVVRLDPSQAPRQVLGRCIASTERSVSAEHRIPQDARPLDHAVGQGSDVGGNAGRSRRPFGRALQLSSHTRNELGMPSAMLLLLFFDRETGPLQNPRRDVLVRRRGSRHLLSEWARPTRDGSLAEHPVQAGGPPEPKRVQDVLAAGRKPRHRSVNGTADPREFLWTAARIWSGHSARYRAIRTTRAGVGRRGRGHSAVGRWRWQAFGPRHKGQCSCERQQRRTNAKPVVRQVGEQGSPRRPSHHRRHPRGGPFGPTHLPGAQGARRAVLRGVIKRALALLIHAGASRLQVRHARSAFDLLRVHVPRLHLAADHGRLAEQESDSRRSQAKKELAPLVARPGSRHYASLGPSSRISATTTRDAQSKRLASRHPAEKRASVVPPVVTPAPAATHRSDATTSRE